MEVIYRARALLLPGGTVQDLGTAEAPHLEGPDVVGYMGQSAYLWRDGVVIETILFEGVNVLIGTFPAHQQAGDTVYGGSPMSADVLQVMGKWGLTQEQAVALMHEDPE